jgi:hypothetical protein
MEANLSDEVACCLDEARVRALVAATCEMDARPSLRWVSGSMRRLKRVSISVSSGVTDRVSEERISVCCFLIFWKREMKSGDS